MKITDAICMKCTSALDANLQQVHNFLVTSESDVSLRARKMRERRTAIHTAAVDLVFDHSLDTVTVAHIAEAAEVSTRTFFNYFPTKEMAILGFTESADLATDVQQFVEDVEPERERLAEDLAYAIRATLEFLVPRSTNRQKVRTILSRYPHLSMLSLETRRFHSDQILAGVRRRIERRGVEFADEESAARTTRMLAQLCSIPIEHTLRSAKSDAEQNLSEDQADAAFTSSVELFLTVIERLK